MLRLSNPLLFLISFRLIIVCADLNFSGRRCKQEGSYFGGSQYVDSGLYGRSPPDYSLYLRRMPMNYFVSLGTVAEEIIRALISSSGLLLAVPLTTIIATIMVGKNHQLVMEFKIIGRR